jgi:uncharacterized protein (TIGR03435 family)
MKPDMKNIDDVVHRYLPSASNEDVESGGARVLQRLESSTGNENALVDSDRRPRLWWQLTPVRAAALAGLFVVAAVTLSTLVLPERAYAIVQSVNGSLYRVADGRSQAVHVGEKIDVNTPLRTESGAGAVLKLSDGASIEMHEKSQVLLEATTDGLRIKVNDGGVRVTPAKQPAGNLYVQTKDVTVPVVAAMVQLAVNPSAGQNREPREAFETVSIRMRPGTGGGGGQRGAAGSAGGFGKCNSKTPQVDPSRFSSTNSGIYYLITYAYGLYSTSNADFLGRCLSSAELKLLSGGPDWVDDDWFDVEATIPEGPPVYTGRAYTGGGTVKEPTPRLQKMVQAMLEERFKLVLRRETKELPVYVLTQAKDGHKLTPWKEGDPAGAGQMSTYMIFNPRELPYSPKPNHDRQIVSFFYGAKATSGWLAGSLSYFTKRMVLDRTGLTGDYNYQLVFAPVFPQAGEDPRGLPVMSSPTVFQSLQQDLGLELKPSTEKVDVYVIEHLERPTEN